MSGREVAELRRQVAELHKRVAALEEIIASRLGILPEAVEASTVSHKDAAFDLGVSAARISQMIAPGRLATVRFGNHVRITRASLDAERRRRCLTIKGDALAKSGGTKAP